MHGSNNITSDPRRPEKEHRYRPPAPTAQAAPGEDLTPDFMNILGMIFSMCGLMMRLKWCAWVALYCSCISFANSRVNDDTKQILSSFISLISTQALRQKYLLTHLQHIFHTGLLQTVKGMYLTSPRGQ